MPTLGVDMEYSAIDVTVAGLRLSWDGAAGAGLVGTLSHHAAEVRHGHGG